MEALVVGGLLVAFFMVKGADNFEETLSIARRGTLYGSVASTAGALLGFTLAALSILVALPSTERVEALRKHHSWPRVTGSYFRAAGSLGCLLILATVGIALDAAKEPWLFYEVITVALAGFAIVQTSAAVVGLYSILTVARQREPLPGVESVNDP